MRKAFYSFHYTPDNWRASQVRQMGALDGNEPAADNDWESVTKGGDAAIKRWIDGQLDGRSCTIVLIGTNTAGRKWINYEIKKSWEDRKGLLGVHVHGLKDTSKTQSTRGSNPFAEFMVAQTPMSNIVKTYDPPHSASTDVYAHIKSNLATWIEDAITLRAKY